MFSKIARIGLVAALAFALVVGTAYILLRPADALEARSDAVGERGRTEAGEFQGAGEGYQGGRGTIPGDQGPRADREAGNWGKGSVDERGGGTENGLGYRGGQEAVRGSGQGAGASYPPDDGGDHPVETWLTVTGTVVALDDDLTLQTADGEMVVHLGPEWYWETLGVALEAGDSVAVSGFYEEGEFEAGCVENLNTAQTVNLRDETGRPLWAGRGRQGG